MCLLFQAQEIRSFLQGLSASTGSIRVNSMQGGLQMSCYIKVSKEIFAMFQEKNEVPYEVIAILKSY